MNRKELKEKLSKEKDAEYISEIEHNEKTYVKALKSGKDGISYIYYEIVDDTLKEIEDQQLLSYFKEKYEIKPSKIIY